MAGLLDLLSSGDANDPVKLMLLRQQALDEEKHNADVAKQFPRTYASGATASDIASGESDLAEDPYTGKAAMAGQAKTDARLADQNAYMDPAATEVRQSRAQDKLAELLAVPQQQGANAIALEREKQKGEAAQAATQHGYTMDLVGSGAKNDEGGRGFTPTVNPAGGVSLKGTPPHKPTTEEQRALDTMGSLESLGPAMLTGYESEYPGIEKDPSQYGGLYNMLTGAAGGALYKTGYVSDNRADQLKQLTGYLEAVLPRMLSSGRINREQYADLKLHVPQLGLSAGANYSRAKYVLDQILPHVRAAVGTGLGAGPAGGGDPYANPDYHPQ